MGKTIWLVILCDRHVDDTYRAATTRKRAEEIASELMQEWWAGRYGQDWKRAEDNEKAGWFFIHDTFDDGPSLHIEQVDVKP